MPRLPRLPADAILDLLASGKLQKEIAYENALTPTAVESVLVTERRRRGCRTNMQLLALYLKLKASDSL